MKKALLILTVLFFGTVVFNSGLKAQEKEKKFGISFSGYVKNDFFYDTREVVSAREGFLLLWPTNITPDANGVDINEHGKFNFLAIQTRLKGSITGPDAFGAKTSGVIEGEFFGTANADVNGFRLRHAIVKLDWENSQLLTGQYWHPLFVTECFPGTVSFNTGIGFQPFARNPQIKYSYKFGNIKLAATVFGERDFASRNMLGVANSDYIRNGSMPAANLHFNYGTKNADAGTALNTGFTVNYKSIRPSLTTTLNYITNETVDAISGSVYVNAKFSKINIKLAGSYVQNGSEVFIPGGYGIASIIDPSTNDVSYSPTAAATGWIDISTTGKKWNVGVFAGYNQNMGSSVDLIGFPGGLGTNLAHLYRVSPRVFFISGKVKVGAEVEYTVAGYGDGTYDIKGIPLNPTDVANVRILTAIYYSF